MAWIRGKVGLKERAKGTMGSVLRWEHTEGTRGDFMDCDTFLEWSNFLFFYRVVNTNLIVSGLTRPGREPTIYRTRGEHA